MQQFQITLTEEQLKRLVRMAKKGGMSKKDSELIEFLEYQLKHGGIKLKSTYYSNDFQPDILDEIPF